MPHAFNPRGRWISIVSFRTARAMWRSNASKTSEMKKWSLCLNCSIVNKISRVRKWGRNLIDQESSKGTTSRPSPCFPDRKGPWIFLSSLYSFLCLSMFSHPGSSKISMANSSQFLTARSDSRLTLLMVLEYHSNIKYPRQRRPREEK